MYTEDQLLQDSQFLSEMNDDGRGHSKKNDDKDRESYRSCYDSFCKNALAGLSLDELRPEASAFVAADGLGSSTSRTNAETASTGRVPRDVSTNTARAVRTEPSVDKNPLAIQFDEEPGGFLEPAKPEKPTRAPPKHLDRVRWFYGQFPTSRCVEASVNGIFYRVHGPHKTARGPSVQTRCVIIQGVAASCEANQYVLRAIARRRADRGLCVVELDNIGIGRSMCPRARKEYTIERMAADVAAVVAHVWEEGAAHHVIGHSMGGMVANPEFEHKYYDDADLENYIYLHGDENVTSAYKRLKEMFPEKAP